MDKIYINTEFIKLQQALKLANVVGAGSDAKMLIQNGYVKVNDEVCTMRGKKVRDGDVINFDDEVIFEIKNRE
ncbi:MAG: RNA-binding S4 domain-containing protein [Lachnospirales bacterium]